MSGQQRDESGEFTEKVTDQDVLKVFDYADEPVLTASEVASELPITREAVGRRLNRMREKGLVDRKETGARAVAWWAEVAPRLSDEARARADAVLVLDEEGRFTHLNDQAEDLLERSEEELRGQSIAGTLPEIITTQFEEEGKNALAEQVSIEYEEFYAPLETWLKVQAVPIDDGLMVHLQNITERKQYERDLKQRTQAMEEAPVGVTISDITREDEPLVYANEQFRKFTGYDEEAVLGRNCRFLQGEDTDPEAVAAMRQAIDNRESVSVELLNYRKDGTEFWNRVTIAPIGSEHGEATAYVGFQEDITERKEYEREIKRERDRFATLFENIPDPSVTADVEDGEPIARSVNDAFEDVFGYARETVVGEPLNDFIVPSNRTDEATAFDQETLDDYEETDVCRRTADGDRREFLFRSVPIQQGNDHEVFGIYTDVTERREHERYRRQLYEITADTEAATDETIARMLELGREYFGMESAFLTHIDIGDGTHRIVNANSPHDAIQPDNECPLSEAYCRKTVEMDEPLTIAHAEASGWDDDPAYERFGLEAYAGARLTIDGDRYGTICFADRTPRESEFSELDRSFIALLVRGIESTLERHKYEMELERQNEQLGEFASVISHDLRNPLTVADGFLELANETGDDEFFTKVGNAHDRMDAIIEDVLTLTRQGERIAETTTVGLAAVAEDAWTNVATAEAELAVDEDLGTVDADEGRLTQLFENLYRNAIDHAGEDVTVRVGRSPTGFYVEDDGPGIPEDERDSVFDSGYTTGEDGTGLGLSIVETIATAHEWEIDITDGAEDGARFEIQRGMVKGGSKESLLSD